MRPKISLRLSAWLPALAFACWVSQPPSELLADDLTDGVTVIDPDHPTETLFPALSAYGAAYVGTQALQPTEQILQERALAYCQAQGFDQVLGFATTEDRSTQGVKGFLLRQPLGAYCPSLLTSLGAHLWSLPPEASFQEPCLEPHLRDQQIKALRRHMFPPRAERGPLPSHYALKFSRLQCGYAAETLPLLQTFLGPQDCQSPEGLRLLKAYRALPAAQRLSFLLFFSSLNPPVQNALRAQPPQFWRLLGSIPACLGHLKALANAATGFSDNAQNLLNYFLFSDRRQPQDRFLADPVSVSRDFPRDFRLHWNQLNPSGSAQDLEAQMFLSKASRTDDLAEMSRLRFAFQQKGFQGLVPVTAYRKHELKHYWRRAALASLPQPTTRAAVEGVAHPPSVASAPAASANDRRAFSLSALLSAYFTVSFTARSNTEPELRPQEPLRARCSICLSEPAITQGPGNCSCFDYCADCAKAQFQQTLAKTGAVARCPAPPCLRPMTREFFENAKVATLEELARFDHQQLSAANHECLAGWRSCQNPECYYGTDQIPQNHRDQHFACPACDQNICLACARSHPDRSCTGQLEAHMVRLLKKGRQARLLTRPDPHSTYNEYGLYRPCPHCGKIIAKAGGCNTMDCPECHQDFHWNRGKLAQASHDDANGRQQYELDPGIYPHF